MFISQIKYNIPTIGHSLQTILMQSWILLQDSMLLIFTVSAIQMFSDDCCARACEMRIVLHSLQLSRCCCWCYFFFGRLIYGNQHEWMNEWMNVTLPKLNGEDKWQWSTMPTHSYLHANTIWPKERNPKCIAAKFVHIYCWFIFNSHPVSVINIACGQRHGLVCDVFCAPSCVRPLCFGWICFIFDAFSFFAHTLSSFFIGFSTGLLIQKYLRIETALCTLRFVHTTIQYFQRHQMRQSICRQRVYLDEVSEWCG